MLTESIRIHQVTKRDPQTLSQNGVQIVPTTSVLISAQRSRRDCLAGAGQSRIYEVLPPDWTLEWIVQDDGTQPGLTADIAQFSFGEGQSNQRQLGEGRTGNLALSRARSELVDVLDPDDVVPPGVLASAIGAFDNNPQTHWVAGQADNLILREPASITPSRYRQYENPASHFDARRRRV
jgi:glycosyltransferase involved in cell wall biosynthesis